MKPFTKMIRRIQVLILLVLAVAGILLWVEGYMFVTDRLMIEKQDEIAANAIKRIPPLKQFDDLFPDGCHFISHVTGREGSTTWNSKVGVFGRYVIEMKIPAHISRWNLQLSLTGRPSLRVQEINDISRLPDGRFVIIYGGSFQVSAAIWKDFLEKKLSIDQLEVPFIKDRPLAGFDKAAWSY